MNLRKIIPVLAAVCICSTYNVEAAKDQLYLPEAEATQLTSVEQHWSVAVPSEEATEVVHNYTNWQIEHMGKLMTNNDHVLAAQQRYRDNVLYYLKVRKDWYASTRKWKDDSYGNVVITRLYNDYVEFFTNHTWVTASNQSDYEKDIVDIVEKHSANVYNDELRSYLNEIVIFSLNESMEDKNFLVKDYTPQPVHGTTAGHHVVDLRKAIQETK